MLGGAWYVLGTMEMRYQIADLSSIIKWFNKKRTQNKTSDKDTDNNSSVKAWDGEGGGGEGQRGDNGGHL